MQNNTVLLGTFILVDVVPTRVIRNIVEFFDSKKIFVFELSSNNFSENLPLDGFLITFNISKQQKETQLKEFQNKFKNTLQLHRNKEHNILYTINALNALIATQCGKVDHTYKVDWTNYKNSCLIISGSELKKFSTRLMDVVDLENLIKPGENNDNS